ncbi:MAG TPA: MFS transporter [Solimonas sp.]|nr:MFS transporter [Solimonas sp.]
MVANDEQQLLHRRLRRNVSCVAGLGFFQVFLVIIPVLVPFLGERGLDVSEVLLLQAVFAGFVLLMEVPSGYIADVFGRVRALQLGALFMAVGHAGFVFSHGFLQLSLCELLLAVGVSLVSGADLALLYDTEQALAGNDSHPEKVVRRMFVLHTSGEALAGIVCSLVLLAYSLDAVAWVQAAVSMLPLLFALGLHEPPGERLSRSSHAGNLREIVTHLLGSSRVLRHTLLALCIWSLGPFYAVWLLQPHWQAQGIDLQAFGYLWGALALVASLSGRLALSLERRWGVTALLAVIGLLPVLGYLGLAGLGLVGGLVASLLFFAARGLGLVVLRDAFNRRVPGRYRATANSFAHLGFRAAYMVTAPLVGAAVDGWGLQPTFVMLAGVAILVFGLLLVPLICAVRAAQPAAVTTAPTVAI